MPWQVVGVRVPRALNRKGILSARLGGLLGGGGNISRRVWGNQETDPSHPPSLGVILRSHPGTLLFLWHTLDRAELLRAKRAARFPEPPLNPTSTNQHKRQTALLHCYISSPSSTRGAAGNGPGHAPAKKGGPFPRTGRPTRTSHYENQVGALLFAAGLPAVLISHCYLPDGGTLSFIQSPAGLWAYLTRKPGMVEDCGRPGVC